MRSMRAARCSGASAVTGIIVVQFGHDAMPFGMSRMSSGFTSATTSGTSGSMRNADDLSMTFAPAAAACGDHSIEIGSSTSTITRSRPSKQPGAQHLARRPRRPSNGSLRPSERGDAYSAQLARPGTRAPRGSATSRCRPCRWHPSHRLARPYSLSEAERRVQRLHRALDVVFGDDARDPDRRRADHLDVDALVRERLEHLGGDTRVRLHARADERDPTDVLVGAEAARLGVDDDLLHARAAVARRRRAAR